MPFLTIDAKTFLKGMSISDELSDGGFSPLSKGINLFAKPGLILPGPAPVDQSSAVDVGGIFAWSTHVANLSPGIGRGVGSDVNNHGKFFLLNDSGGATLACSDAAHIYKARITDLIRYGSSNDQFVTSDGDIAKLNFDFSAQDFTWWHTTLGKTNLKSGVPHRLVQFGAILYITDGNLIHSWDGSAGAESVLDLPDNYVINDMVSFNNALYIAASRFDPLGGGEATDCRIFTWDGFSPSFIEEYVVQENIDTLIVFGSALFLTTRTYVGYWTGSTVSPLYLLTSSVYKHQVAITMDRLYLLQGGDLLCYGNPSIAHTKFFSFPISNPNSLIGITSYRRGKIVYAYASHSGGYSDVNGSDQTGKTFYSNKVFLGKHASLNKLLIESEALASGSDIGVTYLDSRGTINTMPAGGYTFTSRGGISFFTFNFPLLNVTFIVQLQLTFNGNPKGVRRVQFDYDYSEFKGNK